MALVLTDTGAMIILKSYFRKENASADDLSLRLFANNPPTLDDTASLGTFVEAAGGGYVAGGKTLNHLSWVISAPNGIAQAAYAQQIFDFTGPMSPNTEVYGYYIVDADNEVIYAEKASFAYVPELNGGYAVTPVFQLSKGTPS